MKDGFFEGDEIHSFVAILKNESILTAQQYEAELVKKQNERLLY
jgi:hypothetical protein